MTVYLCLQGEKRKEPFMLYTDSPTGSLLRKKIDEFNSTTTGLIMSMVTMNYFNLCFSLFIMSKAKIILQHNVYGKWLKNRVI